jgi:diguanylate cyclase (GGDEF)-like protein/PAS domain S-box-containing protein
MADADGRVPAAPPPEVGESPSDAVLLRSLLEESADRVYFKDVDGRFLQLSNSAAEWFGLSKAEVIGHRDADFFSPQHAQQAYEDEQEIIRTGTGLINVIERETWPDKPDTWVSSTKLPLRGPEGEVIGTWGISRNDTPRVMAEQLLAERSAKLEQVQQELLTVLDGSPDGMMRFDRQLRFVYVNPAAETTLGMTADEVIGRTAVEIGHPPEHERWDEALHRVFRTGEGTELEYVDSVDARARWFQARMVPERQADGVVTGVLVAVRDFTDRKRAEDALAFQAGHDPLTGLANRALFLERVATALRRLEHDEGLIGLLFVDLDRFKTVNDTLGHAAGDWFLHQVGQRVNEIARRADTVARLGGDEFVVLCEGLTAESDMRTVADRLSQALSEPLVYRGQTLPVSASIGIVTCASPDASAERLVADADAAMYQAKHQGGGRSEVFDAGLRERSLARTGLMLELYQALERGEFRLHYQPVLRLADQSCIGVEALIRWQHPKRGLLAPGAFLDVAEQSSFMVELGSWVLDEACRQLAVWERRAGLQISVAVNVSARQFATAGFVDAVADTIARHGVSPANLCLEITETALLEESSTLPETFAGLASLGVRLALDDFGTGYSSLAHLRKFPVHILKVDRSFVSGLGDTEGDLVIVGAVTAMARALGITTVAEGIETLEQLEMLAAMGCDNGQGYLFSKPVDASALEDFLDAQPDLEAAALIPVARTA